MIVFGYPDANVVSIAASPVISLEYHDGYPLFKCSDDTKYIECSFDDTLLECDKILAEHS